MPVALDRARYFGAILSENIAETPEGYRICRNVPIARTGFQTYKAAELDDPDGMLGNDRRPDEEVEVWRDPAEVFSDATIASFEGKTFTLEHPDELLDPDNERKHHAGHIQNVRRGNEPLNSGDLPLLADIIVTDRDAIRAIDSGAREVSCGYRYKLAKEGYRYDQRQIFGNHLALVPKGRAGHEVRIYDAAPEERIDMSIFNKLFGHGFTIAKDAKPEDIAAAQRVLAIDPDFKVPVAAAKDGDPGTIQGPTSAMKVADDAEKEKAAQIQADADLVELESQLNRSLSEGGKEATDEDKHVEGCRCNDCMDTSNSKDGAEEEIEERGDDGEIVNSEPVIKPEDRPKSQLDAALTINVLNGLKPFVARANDANLNKAFDTAVTTLKKAAGKATTGNGSYGQFRKAATRKANDSFIDTESSAQKSAREFDDKMKKIREESRAKSIAARKGR